MKPGDLIRWNRREDALPDAEWLDHLAIVLTLGEDDLISWISVRWLKPINRGEGIMKKNNFEVISEAL